MRSKQEIIARITELQEQKRQLVQVSQLEVLQDQAEHLISAIAFLDKHIGILFWVLNDPELTHI